MYINYLTHQLTELYNFTSIIFVLFLFAYVLCIIQDNRNVYNLVEGEEAVIESPINAFKPFCSALCRTFYYPKCR